MTRKTIIIFSIILIIFCVYLFTYKSCNEPKIHIYYSNISGPMIVLLGGTHGNEPAGSLYLNKLIHELDTKKHVLSAGTLIIIPKVNYCGLLLNMRNVPSIIPWDINRNYYYNHSNNSNLINKYIDYIDNADLVIDIHEGWGYYYEDTHSIGSGIYPTGDKQTFALANRMLKYINSTIPDKYHKFGNIIKVKIKHSLYDYCKNKKINYILIEVTGQSNVQPISVRINQIDLLLNHIIK